MDGALVSVLAGEYLVDEVDFWGDGDDAALVAEVQELADGLAAVGAVVEGALVYVHADETVSQAGVEVAGELHGVFEGFFAVIKGVLNAVVDGLSYDAQGIRTEGAADGIAAQGQDKAGGFAPPDTEVDDLVESAGVVAELALVDDEPGIEFAGENFRDDLIKRDGNGGSAGLKILRAR